MSTASEWESKPVMIDDHTEASVRLATYGIVLGIAGGGTWAIDVSLTATQARQISTALLEGARRGEANG